MGFLRFLGFVATWAGRFKSASLVLGVFGTGAIVMALPPLVLGVGIIVIAVIIYFVVETAINWYPKHIAATRYISLPKQRRMYLSEVADKIAEADHIDSGEVFHSIMRALWRGEFEDKDGNSRVKLPMPPATQHPDNEPPRPSNGHGNPLNPDEVPLEEFSRAMLLYAWQPVNGVNVPSHEQIMETGWKELKEEIDFKKLEGLLPHRYPQNYMSAYLQKLTINQADFKKWLMRYAGGFYEGVY